MKKEIDTSSPEYKRQLAIVLTVLIFLTVLGALLLSSRINEAETKNAAFLKAKNSPPATTEVGKNPR